MMHLRCLVLFLLLLPSGARRRIRIDDTYHDAQQQNNTLADGLEMSAGAREALIPGGLGQRIFRRAGPHAGAWREGSKQDGRRAEPPEAHRVAPIKMAGVQDEWFRSGPSRAKVVLQAASGPEEDQLPPKEAPYVAAYAPMTVQAAWDNHFDAFGGQDLNKIMLDYDETSVVRIYEYPGARKVNSAGLRRSGECSQACSLNFSTSAHWTHRLST